MSLKDEVLKNTFEVADLESDTLFQLFSQLEINKKYDRALSITILKILVERKKLHLVTGGKK